MFHKPKLVPHKCWIIILFFFPATVLSHLLFWYNIKTGGVGQKSKRWHRPEQRSDRTTFKITQLWWIAVYHNTMCLAPSQSCEMFPFVSFWLCGSLLPPPVSALLRRIPRSWPENRSDPSHPLTDDGRSPRKAQLTQWTKRRIKRLRCGVFILGWSDRHVWSVVSPSLVDITWHYRSKFSYIYQWCSED